MLLKFTLELSGSRKFYIPVSWWWLGPIFHTFHDLLPHCMQPLNHLTLRIYDTVPSLSWLKNTLITLISSLFKPAANMRRSRNFRNGVLGPILWIQSSFQLFLVLSSGNSWTYKLLEHQKLAKMISQQPEHSICTRKYSYHS